MKKKIQTFILLIGLWIGLAGHDVTFALESSTDLVEQNDFLGKNRQSILYIGIKSWIKGIKRVIAQHWAVGSEIAIGPVVEWRPLNGIGLQTGLFYSYNTFFTVDFSVDRKRLLDGSLFAFGGRMIHAIDALSTANQGYIAHAGLDHITFHAISLPLFLRLYPEKSRRLICYGGIRFILIFPGIEKKQYCPVHVDTSAIKRIFYDALQQGKDVSDQRGLTVQDIQDIGEKGLLDIYHSIFKVERNENRLFSSKVFNWDFYWDFGIEFRGGSGFIIGINGLGLVLGYDFVK